MTAFCRATPSCVALLVACAPAVPQTGGAGVPRFSFERDGESLSRIEFGVVAMGRRAERKVLVTNVGRGPLLLDGFSRSGSAVFGVDFEPAELAPDQSTTLTFFFDPPEDPSVALVDHAVTLGVQARSVAPSTPALQLELTGRAIRVECDVPTRIDFGAAARGDTVVWTTKLKNPTPIERVVARVGVLRSSQGAGVFALTADSPRGEVVLAPGQERVLSFAFTPTEVRDYSASIDMLWDALCPEVTTLLLGTGVDSVLTLSPATVDFGYVQPGVSITRELTFENRGFKPVELTGLATREGSSASAFYEVVAANPGDLTRLTVPRGARDPATNDVIPGVAKLSIRFRPTVLGPRNGTLVAMSDLSSQPSLRVPLRGGGGGPDIEVLPRPVLDFGSVAVTPGSPQPVTRTLVVRNIGTAPVVPDPRANLRLGAGGGGPPYFSVSPKNAESGLDEICVGGFDSLTGTCTNDLPSTGVGAYDPAVGLVASGPASTLEVPVRVQLKNTLVNASTGTKAWDVTLFSNDAAEPEVRVTVTVTPVN